MPTTRWNGAKTPVNSDAYNLTGDMATEADTTNAIVPVASAAARNALTPPQGLYAGMTVARTDLPGVPFETYSGSAWLDNTSQALSFNTSLYRNIGTWNGFPVKNAAVSRIGKRVSLEGGLANNVAITFTAGTDYVLATLPAGFAPTGNAEFYTALANAYQANYYITNDGTIHVSFNVNVPSQPIGTMVFPLSGLGWNS